MSLLCSALAWVQMKKHDLQEVYENQLNKMEAFNNEHGLGNQQSQRKGLIDSLIEQLNSANSTNTTNAMSVPRVIYASRTHSQISQGN